MESYHKEALTMGLGYLVENIETSKVKVHLLSQKIIDDDDAEQLEREKTERDRVALLVVMLKGRGKTAFSTFIAALRENSFYKHVIQKLTDLVCEAKKSGGKGKKNCNVKEDNVIPEMHHMSGGMPVPSEMTKVVGQICYIKEPVLSMSERGTVIYRGSFQGQDVAVKRVVKHVIVKEEVLLKEMKGKDIPHVLKMLHLHYDEDFAYIVTPLCKFDLKHLIETKKLLIRDVLTPERRLRLSAQLIEGVLNLHDLGIIHGDLKPTNVLVDQHFRVCITDFGTSRLLDLCKTTIIATRPAGTIAWMPTEAQNSGRSFRQKKGGDVQITACLVYYILSDGHHPFESGAPFGLSSNHVELLVNMQKGIFKLDDLKLIANYPSDCVDILTEMLQVDLDKRPALLRCLVKFKVAITSPFETFLAIFSTYLTTSLTEELCGSFQIQCSDRKDILARKVPGFAFLQHLSQKNAITWDNVDTLKEHLQNLNMVQAVAKIQEYQAQIQNNMTCPVLCNSALPLEEKTELFKKRLRERIQQWNNSLCPIPWKKTSDKYLSEVFTESELLLKPASLQRRKVDKECHFGYRSLLSDHQFKDLEYIAVEGDPGSGKTILTAQLASEWSLGKLEDIDIFIPIPLKQVENMTLVDAIRKMWFHNDSTFSKNDIKEILHNNNYRKCVMLDGVEDYTGGDTQNKSMLTLLKSMMEDTENDGDSSCKVVLTARSGYLNDTSGCTVFRIEEFGAEERWSYIQKVIADEATRVTTRDLIENQPVLQHICSVPLLFVLTILNIKQLSQMLSPDKTLTITQFMTHVMKVLCPSLPETECDKVRLTLGEIAFQGLCRKKQKLLWRKEFLERNVANIRHYIDSGILVVEEEFPFTQFSVMSTGNSSHSGRSNQTESSTEEAVSPEKRKVEFKGDFQPCGNATQRCAPRALHQEFPSVPLHVRFLHKIVQEWYAAKHISSVIEKGDEVEINRHLKVISPTDLHYMLRFICGNCEVRSLPLKHVFDHLMQTYLTSMEANDPMILNCLSLCFAETSFNEKIIPYVKRMIDSNPIVFKIDDDGVLQLAKVKLLKVAFDHKLPVTELELDEVVEGVIDGVLLLRNGICIEELETVKKVKISRWDACWEDVTQYSELIKYLVQSQSICEIKLHFPSPPPSIHDDKETVENIRRNEMKVTWQIGQRSVHIFDEQTGIWNLLEDYKEPTENEMNTTISPLRTEKQPV